MILAACTAQPNETLETPVPSDNSSETYLRETQTAVAGGESNEPDVEASPAEETRRLPEDWQNWPIIPEVTNTAREIYEKGIGHGQRSACFLKVADCQNVHQSFLGFFDHPGQYAQMSGIGELQDTIDNFSGYFDRDGQGYPSMASTPLRYFRPCGQIPKSACRTRTRWNANCALPARPLCSSAWNSGLKAVMRTRMSVICARS